jgi:hypothetical protein
MYRKQINLYCDKYVYPPQYVIDSDYANNKYTLKSIQGPVSTPNSFNNPLDALAGFFQVACNPAGETNVDVDVIPLIRSSPLRKHKRRHTKK